MPAAVLPRNRRDIFDAVAGRAGPAAEVHVFEPDRVKVFIEAAQTLPDVPAEHQESPRRLLYGAGPARVPVQAAITPVDGIGRPDTVQTQQLKDQRGGRRETAD